MGERILKYPFIEVNLEKIKHNTKVVSNICRNHGVNPVGVTKVSSGSTELAKAMVDGGIGILGDSKLDNLAKFKDIPAKKMLLRLPGISEVENLVEFADISLNSQIETIRAISKEAIKAGKIHEIVLMVDLGDLREGIFYKNKGEILKTVEKILELEGVKLVGIGTNLTCYGAIIPSEENMGELVKIKEEIEKIFNIELELISGGNSSSLCLIQNGGLPKGINQMRLGTSILLGLVEVTWTMIPNTYNDAFKLKAEIVEIQEKPSMPIGEKAMDAFRNVPTFEDKGMMKRAICAIGKQDCDPEFMIPDNKDINILGSSSDHLILNITNCDMDYKIGDVISFTLDYVAILRCMTSPYVRRVYI